MDDKSKLRGFQGMALSLWLGGVLCASAVAALAADKAPQAPDAFQQNKRLGRGVNVIGYDPLWRSRSSARFQDKHFALIHEAGFQHVRINLHPFQYAKADENHVIGQAWFDTLDWAVRQALANRLMVILDFHEFTRMGDDPQGNKERFLAMWRQIAERYKDSPSEVLFEILNEPNKKLTPELWNQLLREALAIIRRSNPTRTVVIGPASWNNIGYLEKLELPEDDRNIIATVHYYSPMDFTHQGAAWAGRRDKVGVAWNGTPAERQAIVRDFEKAQAWAQRHNRPLLLGEFGAYDKADMPSRVRYIGFVTRQAEKLGWSWSYWQFDSDFIVYDMRKQQWVEPIRDALLRPQNALFAFCMDTHDAKKRSLEEQAALLKELGYDGAGHLWLDQVHERLKTLDAAGLKLYQVYLRLSIAPDAKPPYDPRLTEILPLLKGRDTMLAVLIAGSKPSDQAGDARAVELLREIADVAQTHGVRLALYPHVGDWLERVEDAVRVVKKVDRPNVGVMFNLCHWLRVDDEKNLRPLLEAAMPHLFAVSINGADHAADIRAGKGRMICPLGEGSFDVYGLMRTLRELGYRGPVGLQCYGIPGDAGEHLARSLAAWRAMSAKLADGQP